jgi:hypothetical protein
VRVSAGLAELFSILRLFYELDRLAKWVIVLGFILPVLGIIWAGWAGLLWGVAAGGVACCLLPFVVYAVRGWSVSWRDTREIRRRMKIQESLTHGRVLEIAPTGSESCLMTSRGYESLEREISRQSPHCLVVNLLGFKAAAGGDLLRIAVAGLAAMRKLGAERQFRIVVAGQPAADLDKLFRLVRAESAFAGTVYPDVESALAERAEMQDE